MLWSERGFRILLMSKKFVSSVEGPRQKNPTRETLLSKSLSRKRVEPKGQMTPFGSSQPADWGKVLVSL